jgi:peptidoglycan hydrolase-like protein with peptidoglycan-binding domain
MRSLYMSAIQEGTCMHSKKRNRFALTTIFIVLMALFSASIGGVFPSTVSAATASWPTEEQGSAGENVISIQLFLLADGYSLSVDGSFGPQTTTTVEEFQSAHGLSADGIVGPQTWSTLVITTSEGSTGPAVEALQRQLNANGENVTVDSDFGPLTQQAVSDFQSSRGLSVDGIAGPQTWENLLNQTPVVSSSSWPTEEAGNTGENVYSIQLMLQSWGYSLSIDGDFGPQTTTAVEEFQSAHGLSVDGIVGPQTWAALIISTSEGSSGSAVVALQRQLDTHGANLTTDGSFGPLTAAAVENFQSSQGISVDGIAGPQTWQHLLNTSGSGTVTPPPTAPSGSTLWGVDTTDLINGSSDLSQVTSTRGTPDFIGQYLNATRFTPMTAADATYIHSQGIRILVIESDLGSHTTYSEGVSLANEAISTSHSLGIPGGVAIFNDVEAGDTINASYIEGWYDTISSAGYVPGYYNNPYASSSEFDSAFCGAISSNAAIATHAILYASEPSIGWTTKSNAPAFAPAHPYCNGVATGNVLAWQYALPGGGINVDTDEINASVPLW